MLPVNCLCRHALRAHHASDFEAANAILPSIPKDQHNTIARFLESQGFKEEALLVADDPDIKFDLALQLNKLDVRFRCCLRSRPAAGKRVVLLFRWHSAS